MTHPRPDHYTTEHEWLAIDNNRARVGITDYAQDSLGDIVHIELPDIGATLVAGESIGEIESTKSVSDIYAPIDGTVTAVNAALADDPSIVNSDPLGDGWLFEFDIKNPDQLDGLLTADEYRAYTGQD
jgi:glycine cleavage system H protein